MRSVIDFGFAWNWEYDRDFANLLEANCRSEGLSFLSITPETIASVATELGQGNVLLRVIWDRAADTDDRFLELVNWAKTNNTLQINPYEKALRAWNKATMHLEFITAGVNTPYTIVLDPYNIQPVLPKIDLSVLGDRFIIKPAHGGGGLGVILDATSLERVVTARRENPEDFYLLQAAIEPVQLNGRPAWFRIIYGFGKAHFCWWDIKTHIYTPFSNNDKDSLPMPLLNEIIAKIAVVTGLDVFSSEIALTAEGKFVVVDYINDPMDLRLQSMAIDGVPDEIVRAIASDCVATVKRAVQVNATYQELENKRIG
ncbi:MAG TPA: hypothetical protein P5268_01495 [Candidatus Marinimicrobia bacterium]|nr:hypothetical protein [Candidatus Neomarinimicrobiota bacterium]HRS50970.1 hypothetical protein [Candidatus Neomarinimicrobiota bacterium]HRU91688.1 hypothetical protein [Candidatus Neomarinimicrobiota bacterium]